jgi:hypothetical protein
LALSYSVNQVKKFKDFCVENEEACTLCEESEQCSELKEVCEDDPKVCKKMAQQMNGCIQSGFAPAKCSDSELAAFAEEIGVTDLSLKCFSGDSIVTTEKGQMTMAQFQTMENIKVLAWNKATGKAVFSPVQYWAHANREVEAGFLEIKTQNGHSLSISGTHLIYRSASCSSERETVFADKVKVGDCLYTGEELEADRVKSVGTVFKQGYYAPITEEGSIVVGGVAASCFAQVENEQLAQIVSSLVHGASTFLRTVLPTSISQSLFDGFENLPQALGGIMSFKSVCLH